MPNYEHPWPQVPVGKHDGRVPHWEPPEWHTLYEWRDNWEWEATLCYVGIEREGHSAHFLWRDAADVLVPRKDWDGSDTMAYDHGPHVMFLQQMGEILERGESITREITGIWTWVKRGSNYGVRLVRKNGDTQ